MLQNKDITKIREIKRLFSKKWLESEVLYQQIKLFKITPVSLILKNSKKGGIDAWDLFQVLLILPFANIKNVYQLFTVKFTPKKQGKKDAFYRLLGNQNINWRSILLYFVVRFLKLEKQIDTQTNSPKCLIFDDTTIAKTGKTIEGISKVYDHITHRFILGYKLLVAGYWNGSVFIPVDFSFHRENKKSKTKKYGLTNKERKKQHKTTRKKGLPVVKRFKELNAKKTDIIIEMFKRINRRKISVEYILMDSWFTNISLIKKLLSVNKSVQIIGMYKFNSKVLIKDTEVKIKSLRKNKVKKLTRSRKTGFYYKNFIGEIDGLKVKIFLVRKGKRGNWQTLLTTDTSLSFTKVLEIYSIRWSIEVFFKEAKQLLGMGKSQSVNFDVQVAQMSITMIQYILLSLKYSAEAYATMGNLFADLRQQHIQNKLNARILQVIIDLLNVLELLGIEVDFNVIISKLIVYSDIIGEKEKGTKSINSCKLAS